MPSLDELRDFFSRDFPQSTVTLEDVSDGRARVRQTVGFDQLRPGGTVSGAALMATADAAAYAAVLSEIGIEPLVVTTSFHIALLRRPTADGAIVAEAAVLELGPQLAVVEVRLTSEGDDALVAHATATYAIPQKNV
jgi:uncharacterized protein (TIGR00369 family)